MERLLKFLTELNLDPFKRLAFARDPESTAAAAGLEPWERAALRGSNPGSLEPGADLTGNWQRCAIGWDPGPDPLPDPDAP